MPNHASRRRHLSRTLLTTLAVGLYGLVGFHIVSGDSGLLARQTAAARLALLQEELGGLAQEKAQWQRKVDALSVERVDLDMLGAQARRVLYYAGDDEVILALD